MKQDQGHQTQNDNVDPKLGYNHAKFERSRLNSVFIDFKVAFDKVWLAALWATMKKYNISANLI